MAQWTKIGDGSYNVVYQSEDGSQVLRIQKDANLPYDTPERSMRLWNEFNPQCGPTEIYEDAELGRGWVRPYIVGEQATQDEICDKLIDIYNTTGRIVVDALSEKNMMKTTTGQIVCVDIGMALQLDLSFSKTRRNSKISHRAWSELQDTYMDKWHAEKEPPPVHQMIKALLFINTVRPNITDASFLKDKLLVDQLAEAYGRFDDVAAAAMERLDQIEDPAAPQASAGASHEATAQLPTPAKEIIEKHEQMEAFIEVPAVPQAAGGLATDTNDNAEAQSPAQLNPGDEKSTEMRKKLSALKPNEEIQSSDKTNVRSKL